MRLHEFKHTFRSGDVLSLTVDLGLNPPRFLAQPRGLAIMFADEYNQWLQGAVVPAVMELCDEKQILSLAKVGKNAITA